MLKKLSVLLTAVLMVALILVTVAVNVAGAGATEKATLNISVVTTNSRNDLVKTLNDNYNGIKVYSSLDTALSNVQANGTRGIMVLADNYPTATTVITDAQASQIKSLGIRLYVEYPTNNETLGITGFGAISSETYSTDSGKMLYDRAIVMDAEALDMEMYSLLYAHGARYAKKTDISNSWLVNATVVGYDTVEFYNETTGELTDCTPYSMLEVNDAGDVIICSTKFSQFITARHAPYERWKKVWLSILSFVSDSDVTDISWTPLVNPNYGPTEELADNAYAEAVRLNAEWFLNSTIIDPKDGTSGVFECLQGNPSAINDYGKMYRGKSYRADCNGESAGALALAGALLGVDNYKTVAKNVIDCLFDSELANGDRSDPTNPQYGLLSWHNTALNQYYGDDNAKAILGLIIAASALETDEYDQRILEAIIANFRTTGVNGFRGSVLKEAELEASGWEYFYTRTGYTNYRSHFESLLWACYLWAYDQTGYEPLLDRTKTAIGLMMESYEKTMADNVGSTDEWFWTNGMQQERAKMILCLAWLARLEPTEEHIGWLDTMVSDMMAYQDPVTGAIREVKGENGQGNPVYTQFSKNSDYGKHESPVIQNNGDPCTDALYTSSFAMMTLNEAFAAMTEIGNSALAAKYDEYARSVSDYHVRIQQVSSDSYYNGLWFRGFDYVKWETYGSDGDSGWGVWCAETGWCQARISATLSLRTLGTNIWDYTEGSAIENHFAETAALMLEYDPESIPPSVSADVTLKSGTSASQLVDSIYGSTSYSDGKWTGAEGTDITIIVEFPTKKSFDIVTLGFNHNMSLGICVPASVTFYVSNDGINYESIGTYIGTTDVQAKYTSASTDGAYIERASVTADSRVNAKYVKAVIKNAGTFTHPKHGAGTKTWIFMDEIEFSYLDVDLTELGALIDQAATINTDGYTPGSILAFIEAYENAVEYYNSAEPDPHMLQDIYEALDSAIDGLSLAGSYAVITHTNFASQWGGIGRATDGNLTNTSLTGKLITDLSTLAEQQLEVILDMGTSTGIYSIGYAAEYAPTLNKYLHDAEFFVSDSQDGPWVSVGTVYAQAHRLAPNESEFVAVSANANGGEGRYVKIVFTRNDSYELTFNGKHQYSEWIYLSEILINEFCSVDVITENVSATVTDGNGDPLSALGSLIGKDLKVTLIPDENCILSTVTVNGEAVAVLSNQFTVTYVTEDISIVATYANIPEEDMPVIKHVNDLIFAVGEDYDLLADIEAYDKNGKDISSSVIVVYENIANAAGTYTVTYQVTDDFGATTQASASVQIKNSLSGIQLIGFTPSSKTNVSAYAYKLTNGAFAPDPVTTCWDSNFVSWQNNSEIELVFSLGGQMAIADLGYSLIGCPQMGILPPDVELYYADVVGEWTYAGTIEAVYHPYAMETYDHINNTIALKNTKANYVKVIIKFDNNADFSNRYAEDCSHTPGLGRPEWTFIDEIIINPYYSVSSTDTEGGSVNVTTSNPKGALYGESATVSFTADAGYALTGVKVNGVKVNLNGSSYTISGITEHQVIEPIFEEYQIRGAAVKLAQSISLVYYVVYDGNASNLEMRFDMNGIISVAYAEESDEYNVYLFEFTGISPQLMGDNVSAELYVSGTLIDTKLDYSIKTYCDAMLQLIDNRAIEGYTNEQYSALKSLLADMLEYGAIAQEYKGYKDETPVNEGIDGKSEFTPLTEESKLNLTESSSDKLGFVSAGIRFDYVNCMYFKFSSTVTDSADVVIRVTNNKTGAAREYTLGDCVAKGTTYTLYSEAVIPTEFDTFHTVELCLGGEVVQTLRYSVASYVYYIQNQTGADGELTAMARLSRAMYCFGISAKEYKELN